jgi:hypothetical protein
MIGFLFWVFALVVVPILVIYQLLANRAQRRKREPWLYKD